MEGMLNHWKSERLGPFRLVYLISRPELNFFELTSIFHTGNSESSLSAVSTSKQEKVNTVTSHGVL